MEIINSLDIIKALQELKEEIENIKLQMTKTLVHLSGAVSNAMRAGDFFDLDETYISLTECVDLYVEANNIRQDWIDSFKEHMQKLEILCDQGMSINLNWNKGVELILNSDFKDYIYLQETDFNSHLDNVPNYIVIDWHATAENLKEDYLSVTYNNKKYLIRKD